MQSHETDYNLIVENFGNVEEKLTEKIENNCENLTIVHQNIRSIRKNWETFNLELQQSKIKWDLILLTEIGIKENEKDLYKLEGYSQTAITREQTKVGGGIMCLIKNNFVYESFEHKLDTDDCLVVKTEWKGNEIVIIVLYRQPLSSKKKIFVKELEILIDKYNKCFLFLEI